jgi:DNA-binding NarL/FixJ family response regulator
MGQRKGIVTAPAPSRSKRVVIVDDHPLIRQGLERLINSGDRFAVCGGAGDGAGALKLIRETEPQIAIIDIELPDTNGIELTKEITATFPEVRVLVLSMHDDAEFARRALNAGASGYMVKNDATEKIENALENVWNGRRYLSDSIAGQVA